MHSFRFWFTTATGWLWNQFQLLLKLKTWNCSPSLSLFLKFPVATHSLSPLLLSPWCLHSSLLLFQPLMSSTLIAYTVLQLQLILKPPGICKISPTHPYPTINCLHALVDMKTRGELQVFLFGFDGSERSGFLIFSLMESSAARGLCGPIACLFIYFEWPMTGADLCQHGGPASCYYWPHTHKLMHIQTCNILHIL